MENILKEVLKKIVPTPEEHREEQKIISEIFSRLEKYDVKPILVGSIAKGTDIRGSKDIDVFIMFRNDVSREELEKRGLEIGRKVFSEMKLKTEIDYAEHPYIKGYCGKYVIEIVPCYETKEMKSAVDRTPYHTHYIKQKFLSKPGLRDEVRLLKQFMKGCGVYGAEAKTEGFSGYLTELLIINYGSFLDTLKASANWVFGETLDPENLWDEKNALKYFFTNADLIIVDPVDKNRNAAAAVSRQRLAEFINASRNFLEKPSIEYFFPKKEKPLPLSELRRRMKKRATKFVGIEFTHEKINENTLHSQLRKTINSLKTEIESHGFRVMKTSYWTNEENKSTILLELEIFSLPKIKKHVGPPVDKALTEQKKFLSKYRKYMPYIEGSRWVADIPRKYTKIEDLMADIIKERNGFGKNLRETRKIKTIYGENILVNKDEEYRKTISRLLTPI